MGLTDYRSDVPTDIGSNSGIAWTTRKTWIAIVATFTIVLGAIAIIAVTAPKQAASGDVQITDCSFSHVGGSSAAILTGFSVTGTVTNSTHNEHNYYVTVTAYDGRFPISRVILAPIQYLRPGDVGKFSGSSGLFDFSHPVPAMPICRFTVETG